MAFRMRVTVSEELRINEKKKISEKGTKINASEWRFKHV